MIRLILYAIFFGLLAGCGPREIGEGTSYEAATRPEATAADIMRLPMSGINNTQKMLYMYNHPAIMASMRQSIMQFHQRQMGIEPSHPDYRAVPKERSPFRQ